MARITSLGLFGTPWTASPLFGEDIPVGPQPTPPTTVKVFGLHFLKLYKKPHP